MKKAMLGVAVLLALPSATFAQDAQGILRAAQEAMGLSELSAITIIAHGDLKDTGEAAGGNAPRPVVESYGQALDLQTPAMQLRIHRTNPDGTALIYGSEESQFVSGNYVWQEYTPNVPPGPPGGGGPLPGDAPAQGAPPAGVPDPAPRGTRPPDAQGGPGGGFPTAAPIVITNNLAELRRAQIWLNPAGFIAAALAGDATISEAGGNKVVTFTVGKQQTFAGTFDGANLLTGISTTDPLTGEVLEAAFTDYQDFGGVSFPVHIVHREGREAILDLVVTAVDASSSVVVAVPEAVAAYYSALPAQ